MNGKRIFRAILFAGGSLFAVLILAVFILASSPSLAAQTADWLRGVIGNDAVTTLETILFTTQDAIKQITYKSGLQKAQAPWQAITPTVTVSTGITKDNPGSLPGSSPQPTATPNQIASVQNPPLHEINNFQLASIKPIGTLDGEGIWTPYLYNTQGQVVADRTFLQPDPNRPYSIMSIVGFDLSQTRLNFVLGTDEPKTKQFKLPGRIPNADLIPGKLIATFNGGFKAQHGAYGAMANGINPLLPIHGMGTVGIYKDGHIQIGAWGQEILPTDPLIAYRQNAPLIIHQGKVTPEVYKNTIYLWGGTLNGDIVTYRSGIATNTDNSVLYYFCGPSLDLLVMARALEVLGVNEAMQLDINNFWVHFTAINTVDNQFVAEALMPDMKDHVDRYLNAYSRDFFYITTK